MIRRSYSLGIALLCIGLLCLMQARAQLPLTGAGQGAPSGAASNTIYTANLATNDSGDQGVTWRITAQITGGAQTSVRVTLTAADAASVTCNHVAIGKSVADTSTGDTTATPVEIKYGGSSGCGTITAGASSTSDWVAFSGFTGSDALVVIVDNLTNNFKLASGAGTVGTSFKAATQSWNVQTVTGSGYSHTASIVALAKIETQ